MKLLLPLILAPSLVLSGCATRVYDNGKPVLAVYSNTSHLEYHSPHGTSLVMDNVDNSTPTRVGLDGITKAGTAIATAILTKGLGSGFTGAVKK